MGNKFFRVGRQIRANEVFLVDATGEPVGKVFIEEALRRAEESGLDLVEVAPNANPPVCRIVDFGKFKYEQEKLERKQKARNKGQDLKEIRLSIRINENDLKTKVSQARGFLEKKHKLKATVRLRGREMAFSEKAFKILDDFWKQVEDLAKIETPAKRLGNQFVMFLVSDIGARNIKTNPEKPKPQN